MTRSALSSLRSSLPKRGSVIGVPSSPERRARLRTLKRSSHLYPARVICGVPVSGKIIVRYLDNIPATPVTLDATVSWCELSDVPSRLKDPSFDRLVAAAPPYISAYSRLLSSRARKPSRPKLATPETTVAKWRQKCRQTGTWIEKGDRILKTALGWTLYLPTPPLPESSSLRLPPTSQAAMAKNDDFAAT